MDNPELPKEKEQPMKTANAANENNSIIKPQEKHEVKQTLIDALYQLTDQEAREAKRKRKERIESQKIIINGFETSVKEMRDYLVANALPYSPMFPNDNPFFKEIYRLNKWTDRDPNEWIKPLQVPNWINLLIYNRFPPGVLPALQVLNQYIPGMCIRGYKHFQFLNEEGQRQVEKFRDEAIAVMEKCDTWHEFRIRMANDHGVRYSYYANTLFGDLFG